MEYPPNLCADLIPYVPPMGDLAYTEPYDPAEGLGEGSIVSGTDILAWTTERGLDLATDLAPFATADWQFFAVPWAFDIPDDSATSEAFQGFVLPMQAVISYQAADETLTIPTSVFGASLRTEAMPNPNHTLEFSIVSDVLYGPQDAEFVQVTAEGLRTFDEYFADAGFGLPEPRSFWIQTFRTQYLFPDAFVQTYGGPTNDALQKTSYTNVIGADDPAKTVTFAPAPAMPRFVSMDLTMVDPMQLFPCSSRTATSDIDALLQTLPPQRNDVPEFDSTVFTPSGWVRSDVVYEGVALIIFAAEVVNADDIAVLDADRYADQPHSMFILYTRPDSGAFEFSGASRDFYRVMPFYDAESWRNEIVLDFVLATAETEDNVAQLQAAFQATPRRLFTMHPDLPFELTIKPDADAQALDPTLAEIVLLRMGQPEGYIESLQLNPLAVTFTNPETGSTIFVGISVASDCSVDQIIPNSTPGQGYAVVRDGLSVSITFTGDAVDDDILLAMAESVQATTVACIS